MKTLSWLCVLLLATASAFGQGKQMDKDFAVISIEPGNPLVFVNNGNRAVIAYNIRRVHADGSVGHSEFVTSLFTIRAGKPPIIPAHAKVALRESGTVVATREGPNTSPVVGAKLYAVVFEDGEVVGEEEAAQRAFDTLSVLVNAEQEAHGKLLRAVEKAEKLVDKTAAKAAKDAGWRDVEAAAARGKRRDYGLEDPNYVDRVSSSADELLHVRDAPLGGEEAAIALAKGSQKYPKIWRKK